MLSWNETLGDWKWTAETEGTGSNFQAGGGLFAFVFIAIDKCSDVADQVQVEASLDGYFFRAFHIFNIGFQNAVQDLVGRKGVRVLLVGTQLSGGRFLQSRAGDQFPFAINVAREVVNHELRNIRNDGETTGHVAVERAVADGIFRFVAGAENHGTEFVRKGHEVIATNACLDILLGCVGGAPGKNGSESLFVGVKDGGDGDGEELDAEIVGKVLGIDLAAFGGVGAGHGNAKDVFLAESGNGDGDDDGGVNTAAETDDGFGEFAFADVVAGTEDQRLVGAGDFVGRLFVDVAFTGDRVEEDDVVLEGFGLRGDSASGGEGSAGAIKDEGIIAADLIDVDDWTVVMKSGGTKHAEAKEAFVDGKG